MRNQTKFARTSGEAGKDTRKCHVQSSRETGISASIEPGVRRARGESGQGRHLSPNMDVRRGGKGAGRGRERASGEIVDTLGKTANRTLVRPSREATNRCMRRR